MTISQESVLLWDDEVNKLEARVVCNSSQYKYIEGLPCITVGFTYENRHFRGYDYFTFFDQGYIDLIKTIQETYRTMNGLFRLYDMGADTDGFIEFNCKNGILKIKGQLGASFSEKFLNFRFEADQTILSALLNCLEIF